MLSAFFYLCDDWRWCDLFLLFLLCSFSFCFREVLLTGLFSIPREKLLQRFWQEGGILVPFSESDDADRRDQDDPSPPDHAKTCLVGFTSRDQRERNDRGRVRVGGRGRLMGMRVAVSFSSTASPPAPSYFKTLVPCIRAASRHNKA